MVEFVEPFDFSEIEELCRAGIDLVSFKAEIVTAELAETKGIKFNGGQLPK